MARNNQVIRQWHLLRALEASRRGLTLEQLLDHLPEDVPRHPRTLRRDLAALEAAHFPLVRERGETGVRWRLLEGFGDVPTMTLSPTEVMALAFSRHLLTPLDGTELQASLDSALKKAVAAIPPPARTYLQQLQQSFSVGLGPHKRYREHRLTLDTLSRAITQTRTIQMQYYSASRNVMSRREVDPYRLRYVDGGLYLIAYCHKRQDVRMFAVERIRSLTITDHPAQIPLHFDLEAYVQDALIVMRGKRIEVELLFSPEAACWVKDRIWHPSQQLTRLNGQGLRMVLTVADTPELAGWVLSFGRHVTVVRPDSLRTAIEQEARHIAARY